MAEISHSMVTGFMKMADGVNQTFIEITRASNILAGVPVITDISTWTSNAANRVSNMSSIISDTQSSYYSNIASFNARIDNQENLIPMNMHMNMRMTTNAAIHHCSNTLNLHLNSLDLDSDILTSNMVSANDSELHIMSDKSTWVTNIIDDELFPSFNSACIFISNNYAHNKVSSLTKSIQSIREAVSDIGDLDDARWASNQGVVTNNLSDCLIQRLNWVSNQMENKGDMLSCIWSCNTATAAFELSKNICSNNLSTYHSFVSNQNFETYGEIQAASNVIYSAHKEASKASNATSWITHIMSSNLSDSSRYRSSIEAHSKNNFPYESISESAKFTLEAVHRNSLSLSFAQNTCEWVSNQNPWHLHSNKRIDSSRAAEEALLVTSCNDELIRKSSNMLGMFESNFLVLSNTCGPILVFVSNSTAFAQGNLRHIYNNISDTSDIAASSAFIQNTCTYASNVNSYTRAAFASNLANQSIQITNQLIARQPLLISRLMYFEKTYLFCSNNMEKSRNTQIIQSI